MVSSFYVEREQIASQLEAVLQHYLADKGIPPVNETCEEVFGKESIGRFPSAREMRFYIDDIAAFTPELADLLRDQVLSVFKKWKLVAQYSDEVFTVSYRGVSFGDHEIVPSLTTVTDEYRRWLHAARRDDEERRGPLRRQFRHLLPLIPAAIPLARKHNVAVLAAFDRYIQPGWGGDPVVWVLTPGGKEEPFLRPGAGHIGRTVTSEGAIEPPRCRRYWPMTEIVPPYFLHAHEFPWASREQLELVLPGWKGAPDQVIGPVMVESLIRDIDLKARATTDQSEQQL
jgi:hypothetical protein